MAKRAVAGVLASLLVAIVCAGAIIGLVHSDSLHSIHTTSKAIVMNSGNSLCANALHKDSCEAMLMQLAPKKSGSSRNSMFESSLAQDPSAQTKVFKGFVEATLKELEIAAKLVTGAAGSKLSGRSATAKRDCGMLITDALRHAREAIALVKDSDNIKDLSAKADEIVRRFTSCTTYMYVCVDGFQDKTKLKTEMDRLLQNATVTTSNAMTVIHKFAPSVKQPKSPHGSTRKLLGYAMDKHGYPEWLSAGDRKLLQATSLTPNMTVAQDGSGDYKTISDAIKNIPGNYTGRFIIYVKAGEYNEMVDVPLEKEYLTMYGDGMDKTIITGSMSDSDSYSKLESPFVARAKYFIAKDMGFRNTAGPNGHQTVAVRTAGEFTAFYQCKIDSYQDTLFAMDGRQFFRDCTISGTIDFIFGNAAVVFQNCKIVLRKPQAGAENVILAHGRTQSQSKTGVVLQNCDIIADTDFESSCSSTANYLGRPWKPYSQAIIMESHICGCIQPEGWMSWMNSTVGLDTLVFGEYGNSGPGAATDKRVKWPGYHILGKGDVAPYTVESFIDGSQWIGTTGVPSTAGLTS